MAGVSALRSIVEGYEARTLSLVDPIGEAPNGTTTVVAYPVRAAPAECDCGPISKAVADNPRLVFEAEFPASLDEVGAEVFPLVVAELEPAL